MIISSSAKTPITVSQIKVCYDWIYLKSLTNYLISNDLELAVIKSSMEKLREIYETIKIILTH